MIGDRDVEPDETCKVALSDPVNAQLERSVAEGTILNDDTDRLPTLDIKDASVKEGNAGVKPLRFVVKLSEAARSAIQVRYDFAATTATQGDDFRAVPGTLVIPAGQAQGTISAEIKGDLVFEENETFSVKLFDPVQALLGRALATGTIENDDDLTAPPIASIEGVTKAEGNKGNTPFAFRVRLTAPARDPVTIDYVVSDQSGLAGSDYQPAHGRLAIGKGEREAAIVVQVKGDNVFERDETFQVKIERPRNAVLAGDTAIGRIINDDKPDGPLRERQDDFNWKKDGPNRPVPRFLVELHDDFTPMEGAYYFRSGASSELAGTRLVSSELDDDILRSAPSQTVELPAQSPRAWLRDVSVSEYLLPGLDTPQLLTRGVSCRPADNPAAGEFVAAYRVTSQVLVAGENDDNRHEIPAELANLPAGHASWDEAQLRHYLQVPPDPRYRELAHDHGTRALETTQLAPGARPRTAGVDQPELDVRVQSQASRCARPHGVVPVRRPARLLCPPGPRHDHAAPVTRRTGPGRDRLPGRARACGPKARVPGVRERFARVV